MAALWLGVAVAPPALAQSTDLGPPTPEEAPIALLIDMGTGQTLFARNETRRFVPASITKVMTTFVAFERLSTGQLALNQRFEISDETFKEWNRKGSNMFIPRGDRVSVDELLHGITTVSANDGAIVLAESSAGSVAKWLAAMNEAARALGMKNSHFGTPNGWPDEGRTFVTARDLSALAAAMITRHPNKYAHFVGVEGYKYNNIAQSNHDPLIGRVRGADGIKTGFTNEAGFGFLGSAKRDGQRLIMVVAGSPRSNDRNRAARRFMEWGFDAFERKLLFPAGTPIATARVQNGAAETVPLVSARPVYAIVPRGSDAQIALKVLYEGPLRTPLLKAEEVAQLEVTVEGFDPFTVPLKPRQSVPEAGPLQRIANGVRDWFG